MVQAEDGEVSEKPSRNIRLKSGYSLEALEIPDAEILRIKAPDGRICLNITLTPEGPAVELSGVSLEVATQGDLKLNCQRMEINAEKEIAIRSGGDLSQVSQGNIRVEAEGTIETEGFSQRLRARLGDIEATANDDVMLHGERIRLNSPRPPIESRKKDAKRAGLLGEILQKSEDS